MTVKEVAAVSTQDSSDDELVEEQGSIPAIQHVHDSSYVKEQATIPAIQNVNKLVEEKSQLPISFEKILHEIFLQSRHSTEFCVSSIRDKCADISDKDFYKSLSVLEDQNKILLLDGVSIVII